MINWCNSRSAKFEINEQQYQNAPSNGDLTTLTLFDFSDSRGMEKELELGAPIFSNGKIRWQSETCICDLGDLCNAGNNLTSNKNYRFISIVVVFNIFCVMLNI